MFKESRRPEEVTPPVIDSDEALRMYKSGVCRLRKPKPMLVGPGRDANSYDFRGVRAAMAVVSVFPHETNPEGHRVKPDTEKVKVHMGLGLTAIREAGRLPLAGDFIEGYQRMSEAFTCSEELDVVAEQV